MPLEYDLGLSYIRLFWNIHVNIDIDVIFFIDSDVLVFHKIIPLHT